jgi:poly-gamma-glutamate synthesis protein (capsule biosynthesis protein)
MKKRKVLRVLLIISVVVFAALCSSCKNRVFDNNINSKTTTSTSVNSSSASIVKGTENAVISTSAVSQVSLISAGDILFHMPEVVSAQENGTYNFKPMFSEVKDVISSKDITIADFETTINPKKEPSGYPSFNTPVQALDALKYTGFQILLNDHNHSLDTGIDGLRSTNNLLKQYGFKVLGSGEPNEDKSIIVEKNNIKIGMLAYTYGTNYGIQYKDMINYIDENKIKAEIEKIKPKCDFLIVFLHLGTEYVRTVEPFQADLVKKTAQFGADAILCSHPHVARKTEMLNVNGRKVLVNYSMGNFISNQNDKYTDMGSMESMLIEKRNNVTKLKSAETIPVYRLRYPSNNKTIYKTVPYNNITKFKDILGQDTLSYISSVSKELSFKYYDFYPEYAANKACILKAE